MFSRFVATLDLNRDETAKLLLNLKDILTGFWEFM